MRTDVNIMNKDSCRFIMRQWDESEGGFRFAKGCPVTVNASAICVISLEFLNGLDSLSVGQKRRLEERFLSCQNDSGYFCDPLFFPSCIATKNHDIDYFREETTTYCQQALHALGNIRPRQREYPESWLNADSLIKYFEAMNWQDPHLNSNRVMFVLSQFAHDVEVFGSSELLSLVDRALDWIDSHQDRKTGLWGRGQNVPLSHAMAATFHFSFFYFYRRRAFLFPERIIDSCLSLQKADGLFSRNDEIGQTCLDYDALDLLAKASVATRYRISDVEKCFMRARNAIAGLYNEQDGGFANSKLKRLPNGQTSPLTAHYHTGQTICSCDTAVSNVFSTWFRWLAIACANQKHDDTPGGFVFRPLPWLGYHDVHAIRESYNPFHGWTVMSRYIGAVLAFRQKLSSGTLAHIRIDAPSNSQGELRVLFRADGKNRNSVVAKVDIGRGVSDVYIKLPSTRGKHVDIYCEHPYRTVIQSAALLQRK